MQSPREDLVHVVALAGGGYSLYNGTLREITRQCIEEFSDAMGEGHINFDDLLISSLITLAPLDIIFHRSENINNKEMRETVEQVFSGRTHVCGGCPLCRHGR